jgi:hypothetical protein
MQEAGDGRQGLAPANANLQSFADAEAPSILSKSAGPGELPGYAIARIKTLEVHMNIG